MTSQALIVEDDREFRSSLCEYLSAHNFSVREAETLDEALQQIAELTPDVVLLDQFLGPVDTIDKLGLLTSKYDRSLIVLTGNEDLVDRVMMLEGGADDFIIKSTSPREILARVRATIRRRGGGSGSESPPTDLRLKVLEHAGWRLAYETRQLFNPKGESTLLTPGLRNLFWLFLSHPGEPLSRERAYEEMTGRTGVSVDRNVDNFVSRCRRIVETLGGEMLVEPVRGHGYRFMGLR